MNMKYITHCLGFIFPVNTTMHTCKTKTPKNIA